MGMRRVMQAHMRGGANLLHEWLWDERRRGTDMDAVEGGGRGHTSVAIPTHYLQRSSLHLPLVLLGHVSNGQRHQLWQVVDAYYFASGANLKKRRELERLTRTAMERWVTISAMATERYPDPAPTRSEGKHQSYELRSSSDRTRTAPNIQHSHTRTEKILENFQRMRVLREGTVCVIMHHEDSN